MKGQTTDSKYASAATLARRYDTSASTIWRWAASGILPQPIKLGPNSTRWEVAACDAAMERRRSAGATPETRRGAA